MLESPISRWRPSTRILAGFTRMDINKNFGEHEVLCFDEPLYDTAGCFGEPQCTLSLKE